jgi:hypothetical protein
VEDRLYQCLKSFRLGFNLAGRGMPAPHCKTPMLYRMGAIRLTRLHHRVLPPAGRRGVDADMVGNTLEERDRTAAAQRRVSHYRQRVAMLISWRKSAFTGRVANSRRGRPMSG